MPPPDPSSPPPRVTLRDIARRLNVTHVTVSLALRDSPRITPARREQVKAAAREMGYRPDPMLTALCQYRHHLRQPVQHAAIAWLNFWPKASQLRSFREFDLYWRGACAAAESHGYRVEEFCPGRDISFNRLHGILTARGIRGIMLAPPPLHVRPAMREFDWSPFSVVRFGHALSDLPFHVVTCDQVGAGLKAMAAIRARGYRRIGYVTPATATRFKAGVLEAQLDIPEEDRVPILFLPAEDPKLHARKVLAWIERHEVDAIFTPLVGARELLADVGLQVPRDIAVAGTSITDCNVDAGIDQNPEEIGRVAAETLISLINHNHRGVPRFQRDILVEGCWQDGSCLPDRRSSVAAAAR